MTVRFLPILVLLTLGAWCAPPKRVTCSNDTTGFTVILQGRDAIAACLAAPEMQTPGDVRTARVSAGIFAFGDSLWQLDAGWSLVGAGADRTRIVAVRELGGESLEDTHSGIWVAGRDVTIQGLTLNGACADAPPAWREDPCAGLLGSLSTVGIAVICGFGDDPPPDCDVDGLLVEDVRIMNAATGFSATGHPPLAPLGFGGVWTNFLDFTWTLSGLRASGFESTGRYARFLDLGDAVGGFLSQGPGVGATTPRAYRVDLISSDIEAPISPPGFNGFHDGGVTIAVGNPLVGLEFHAIDSTISATSRPLSIGSLSVGDGTGQGEIYFVCTDSTWTADHSDWDAAQALPGKPEGCPFYDATVYLSHWPSPSAFHVTRADFADCDIFVVGSTCADPRALDTGTIGPALTEACLERTVLSPGPARGNGQVSEGLETGFCDS